MGWRPSPSTNIVEKLAADRARGRTRSEDTVRDERGITVIEYALIAALVLVLVVGVAWVKQAARAEFSAMTASVDPPAESYAPPPPAVTPPPTTPPPVSGGSGNPGQGHGKGGGNGKGQGQGKGKGKGH
jgi:Flp pilus assembly pilin Flp